MASVACAACADAYAAAAVRMAVSPLLSHTCRPLPSRRRPRTHLSTLPRDLLAAVLLWLEAPDVERLASALPRAAARDAALWRTFYARRFGSTHPRPRRAPLTRAGAVDWRRAYLDADRRATLQNTLRAAGGRLAIPPTRPAHINVTHHGNVRRVVAATADQGAAPIVRRGGVARFDWQRR